VNLTLRVRDAKALGANFYAADRRAQREARTLTRKRGEFARDLTRFFCPVDTGFMQSHVRLEMSGDGLTFQVGWSAADFTSAGLPFYPPFQEFGTSRMRAQPSLFPAYRETEAAFRDDVKDFYRGALARALRGKGAR
jgi:HK97 gp10 family phage protein